MVCLWCRQRLRWVLSVIKYLDSFDLALTADGGRAVYKVQLPQHVDCLRFDRDGFGDVIVGVRFLNARTTETRLHGGLSGDDVVVDRFERCVGVLFGCPCPAGFWWN